MKNKLLIMALILVVACALTCAHAEQDPVLFTFDGREVRQSEVMRRALAYADGGLISSDIAYREAIDYMILNQLVPEAKAAQLGLDQYSAEELAAIRAEADAYYEQQLDAFVAYFAGEAGESDKAALRKQLQEYWEDLGTTIESAEETHLFNHTRERLMAIMDLTVTDEEIRQVFDEQTAKDEAYFKDNHRAYEYYTHYLRNDIWYVPEGYREMLDLCFPSNTTNPVEEHREALDAALAQLAEGVAFEALTGPNDAAPARILVHRDSTLYSDALVEIAFSDAMREAGSVSEPFSDEDGAHILYTVGDAPSGPVEFTDSIRESITHYLTGRKQEDTLRSWAEEFKVVYNDEAIDALIAASQEPQP